MDKILVVDDSKLFTNLVSRKIASELYCRISCAQSYAETETLLASETFDAAVLDLNLPDAPDGEIVDLVTARGIPAIILTAEFSDDLRERILEKRVFDYFLKDNVENIDHVVEIIKRIRRNRETAVLVVDDSSLSRSVIRRMLEIQQFQTMEASNGEEALALLVANPNIRLVITDYNMPRMNGVEFVSKVRKLRRKDELAVIGVSAYGSGPLTAKFLKSGANDFLLKPFLYEEFYCRVSQNMEILERLQAMLQSSYRDYLTGLYNRKYLFEAGNTLFKNAKRENIRLSVAMIDIDDFKKINDRYGHAAGDEALRQFADLLRRNLRSSDILARVGGEEFCALAVNVPEEQLGTFYDKLRQLVSEAEVRLDGTNFGLTVSIGVSSRLGESLEDMIRHADVLLYAAKKRRNAVVAGG